MGLGSFGFGISAFQKLKDLSLVADGRTLFRYVIRDAFSLEDGTLKVRAYSDPVVKHDLVGLGGAYFHPSLVSALSHSEVLAAWQWTKNQVGDPFHEMAQRLTVGFVLRALATRILDFAVVAPVQVAVNLHKLSKSIEAKPKIAELRAALRGKVKPWQAETLAWNENLEDMVRFLCDINSELELALMALSCRVDVRLATSPDMYINGISVEVKNLSRDRSLPASSYSQKVIDRAWKALEEQHAMMAALDLGTELFDLCTFEETPLETHDFCSTLNYAVSLAKEQKKPILLFHRDPWSGMAEAKVETFSSLKERLS